MWKTQLAGVQHVSAKPPGGFEAWPAVKQVTNQGMTYAGEMDTDLVAKCRG